MCPRAYLWGTDCRGDNLAKLWVSVSSKLAKFGRIARAVQPKQSCHGRKGRRTVLFGWALSGPAGAALVRRSAQTCAAPMAVQLSSATVVVLVSGGRLGAVGRRPSGAVRTKVAAHQFDQATGLLAGSVLDPFAAAIWTVRVN
jgi:hypothetical protein